MYRQIWCQVNIQLNLKYVYEIVEQKNKDA